MLMLALFALVAGLQQAPCRAGEVLEVVLGGDYMLNICTVGIVALRGVEPPLRVAVGAPPLGRPIGPRDNAPVSGGEILGGTNIGPEGVEFLSRLVVGKRVTLVYDGFRIGDRGGRRYAYVYLPSKVHVNAEMIRNGYGYADLQGSHPKRDEFIALESVARRAKIGIWSS